MRLISYVCSFLLLISQATFASNEANHHCYPGEKPAQSLQASPDGKPGFYSCEIEIINDSYSNVTVYGRYDDGVPLNPFNVYSYEYSHYIDLFYNGYCHSGMYLSVVTFSGYTIFSGYVFTGSTVHIVPSLNKQLKVSVEKAK